MASATVADFRGRVSARIIADLVQNQPPQPTLTDEQIDARIQRALDDASAELEGYKPRVPSAHWPAAATLRTHEVKVATYLLTLDRPGKEFESIRNAYTDTIAFYAALSAPNPAGGQPPLEIGATIPSPVFNDRSLKGFT